MLPPTRGVKAELLDIPIATSPTGTVVLGATHLGPVVHDAEEGLRLAITTGRPVFIGVLATDAEVADIRARLDEAASEAVATSYRARG